MDLYEVSDQVATLLQKRGRLAYRMLKLQFELDDEQLAALKEELIDIQEVAADKDGKMLVWTGSETAEDSASQTADASASRTSTSRREIVRYKASYSRTGSSTPRPLPTSTGAGQQASQRAEWLRSYARASHRKRYRQLGARLQPST